MTKLTMVSVVFREGRISYTPALFTRVNEAIRQTARAGYMMDECPSGASVWRC